jgi:hypothetical protein
MSYLNVSLTWVAALVGAISCSGTKGESANPESAVAVQTVRPGIQFDPGTTKRGARIGSLTVDDIVVQRAIDSIWVGSASFSGELTLSGTLIRHPDSDVHAVCFEADSTSASQMPRWARDERRAWFCFSNTEEARRILGADSGRARIVVDQFRIERNLSDAVNSARLLSGGRVR